MVGTRASTIVLGAGLQGAGVALELARRGLPSTLIERDACAIHRASLRNEGKIHLGFIYANDRSLATADLQLEGALRFRRIVASWMNGSDDWLERSTPFQYLVAADSVVAAHDLASHYAAVEARHHEWLRGDEGLDYLGLRLDQLVRPLAATELAAFFEPSRLEAGFATAELAIDTDVLAMHVRRSLADSPLVTFLPAHLARSITRGRHGFRVEGESPSGTWRIDSEQVVNATWEHRLAFDRQLGVAPPADLLHRLKYRVIAQLPTRLHGAPSVSMVLGRYGDIVVRRGGAAFLSWYPAGLRGWSHELVPPEDWDAPCRGETPTALANEIRDQILAGIDAWFPGVADSETLRVDAGAIVAIGRSDVDDAASALHDRTRIGVESDDGYHSVNTGKLTTAPLFAVEVANRVEARTRRGAGSQ
ncbi:MAG: FAD-dependent oxidoreductase [Candidatus Eisenbacteria bacterium]|uniref:FAD-dependent oxidoreductase n=1 Tax=Eiseniibacteriota bacterium TaxID=2212470 RepID=A0A849SP52_UNCEI|nr:FAD-dependent oxidoreductase [Candidatus Eisenbacteria bacterium]